MNGLLIVVILGFAATSAVSAENCRLLETPVGWNPPKWFWKCGELPCLLPYPESAKSAGLEGKVLMMVTIQSDGAPLSGEILESSGHEVLDNGALKHVMRIRYPVQLDAVTGKAICHRVKVPMSFILPSKRAES